MPRRARFLLLLGEHNAGRPGPAPAAPPSAGAGVEPAIRGRSSPGGPAAARPGGPRRRRGPPRPP